MCDGFASTGMPRRASRSLTSRVCSCCSWRSIELRGWTEKRRIENEAGGCQFEGFIYALRSRCTRWRTQNVFFPNPPHLPSMRPLRARIPGPQVPHGGQGASNGAGRQRGGENEPGRVRADHVDQFVGPGRVAANVAVGCERLHRAERPAPRWVSDARQFRLFHFFWTATDPWPVCR